MDWLLLAALFLPVSHFGLASTGLRGRLVARIGEGPYRGLYSLIAAGAFWWLFAAYGTAPRTLLWESAAWMRWAALAVTALAVLLLVAGFTIRNPSAVGGDKALDGQEPARGILRVTRNPFLWSVTLWALAHMLVKGELAALLMFGSLGSLGLIGAPLLDAKMARRHGARWSRFAAVTSNLPFAAILAGRQRFSAEEVGWRWIAAAALFALLVWLHPLAFGASPLP